jgi:signal transduction histidine kinase
MFMAGRPLRVGVFHDVTERKQVEEKIRTMNEELEEKVRKRTRQLLEAQKELVHKEKLAMLGQVAGSVSHELRNPLGVMSNAVFYLQNVLVESDESVKEYLDLIMAEISRSEHIVAGLLDAVRIRSPECATHDVAELIGQILRQCTVPDSVTVTLDIPETIFPMQVDARQMQQVLGNLISNAVEAMPEGGALVIRALENRPEKTITVMVQDSGHGMTPEVLAQLFQPFYTTKARGIGLGLLVTKNLVEANNGRIEVQSEPGKGAIFSIILPGDYKEGNG